MGSVIYREFKLAFSELVEVGGHSLGELQPLLHQALLPIKVGIRLDEFIEPLYCMSIIIAILQILNYLFHFKLSIHFALLSCLPLTSRLIYVIYIVYHTRTRFNILCQRFQNNLDPFLQVVVGFGMLLDDLVVFPNLIPLKLANFIHQRLCDSCAQVVVLGLLVEGDCHQVLVDRNHKSFQVHLLDQFIHIFGQFEQAFDDQAGNLWLISTILILG